MSVYFVGSGKLGAGLIKIGYAEDVAARLSSLQVGSAEPLHLLGDLPGDREAEEWLHNRFGHLRVRGEWFLPAPELLDFIVESLRSEGEAKLKHADALDAEKNQRLATGSLAA